MAAPEFIDTHAHIHEDGYPDPIEALARARAGGVVEVVCVGTGLVSSKQALAFAAVHDKVYATIGVHPHDTKDGWQEIAELAKSASGLVAIGEIGLDYFYDNSPRDMQIQALKDQLQVAVDRNLPVVFHVREAFDDFWPIFDSFHYASGESIRGVLHSFTDTQENLQKGLERGLYIGVNGISTFTKDPVQQSMFASIPFEKMVLETDAPFLTPRPFRGKINEPAFVRNVAEHFVENYRSNGGVSIVDIALETTTNARALFNL